MSELQYKLTVRNGNKENEEGAFFKASPFKIISGETEVSCRFSRIEHGRVVYEVRKNNEVLNQLTHPDYVPEIKFGEYIKPEDLKAEDRFIYSALLHLNISKDKDYRTFFDEESVKSEISFEVQQEEDKGS